MRIFSVLLLCTLLFSSLSLPLHARPGDGPEAKGKPGMLATWTSGYKTGLGTSATLHSKVWFTLGDGNLTEVYYPTLDMPNLRTLDFIISGENGYLAHESRDALQRTTQWTDKSALAFAQTTSDGKRWKLEKRYATDPKRNTVVIDVHFTALDGATYKVYVLADPAIANSGMGDTGYNVEKTLVATDSDAHYNRRIFMATAAKPAFEAVSSGFAGVSDGWTDLVSDGRLDWQNMRAADGNVVQIGALASGRATIAIGFGEKAESALDSVTGSLGEGFEAIQRTYVGEWKTFTEKLPKVRDAFRDQFVMAAMTLAAHEDKTYRGAGIASISIPWGETANANAAQSGGYHLIWARDLYQVASAWLALGDAEAAKRSLDYLFSIQQKPDGGFPQNSWLDGRPYWPSLQLDEVSYPLILAWQLGVNDERTYGLHLRPAAEFILRAGPRTPQERWEEEEGYSPSTIAAEIAGLVCVADIAKKLGRADDATRYLRTADQWAAGVQEWCYTTTGEWDAGESERGYYFRINDNLDPNDGFRIDINNGGGIMDERSVVDAGFLELVRLGIVPPRDRKIERSLKVADKTIRVETPMGPGWYRYNNDGYGERFDGSAWQDKSSGVGRLWPLLTGERGEYAVACGEDASAYAQAMMGFAGPSKMIPEQVWDRTWPPDAKWKFGQGMGCATPLAWSMAQFIRLVMCIEKKRVVEQPSVVREHFQRLGGGAPTAQLGLKRRGELARKFRK
jgi:glucoamylase